ncbi:MAG TPA: FAD:protein FMN transferase [Gammaproteobacteria bacterium]|nr:FAD:protein FMN transferase [Gammaproteobacteria bacterium]
MKRRTYLGGTLAVAARLAVPGSVAALAGCGASGARDALTRLAGPTMGTGYRVSLPQRLSTEEAESVRAGVEAALGRVDTLMSTYRPESELSRFNLAGAGEWIDLSPDTATVIGEAMRVGSVSGGGFDVTVGPLVDLWGFGPAEGKNSVPSDEAIADASARTGADALQFDPARGLLRKNRSGLGMDLCGIAKGHAVDLVAAYLETMGFDSFLIDVGGELNARGRKSDGSRWRVGIERPVAGGRQVQRVVELAGGTIATSGDYRNFFDRDGRRYSHTIDPRTGRPVQHGLASVSVLSDRAISADALSTAMMVLGPEEGAALAERLDVPALFLLRSEDGIVERATRSFHERVVA